VRSRTREIREQLQRYVAWEEGGGGVVFFF
jgi:hypothetical protein